MLLLLGFGHADTHEAAAAAAAGWLRCLHAIALLLVHICGAAFWRESSLVSIHPFPELAVETRREGIFLDISLAPVARERRIKIEPLFTSSREKSACLLENRFRSATRR